MIAHMVYFTLKESTPAVRQRVVQSCQRHLTGHEGTVYFSAGLRAPGFDREVNVKDWDVALHLVFTTKAAHDQYQDHPRHQEFVHECKEHWKQVRVFDAEVE